MKRQAGFYTLDNLAERLRAERKAVGLNQTEFAGLGNVGLGSQSRYEKAETEPGALYLASLAEHQVDVLWILTGQRSGRGLSPEQSRLLDAFNALPGEDRESLLRLACSLAGQRLPPRPQALPSEAALTEAFGAFLEGSPGLGGAELVHELATRLPIILQGAGAEIAVPASENAGIPPEERQAPDAEHREVPRARRT